MTNSQRFNSTSPSPKKSPNYIIPLLLVGITGGAYYLYRRGEESRVLSATVKAGEPVLTNPEEWIDFKVNLPFLLAMLSDS